MSGSAPRSPRRTGRPGHRPIPSCSDPAIGWPPTKRGSEIAATSGALTLPTSVTGPDVAASARRAAEGMADTGVATTVRSAPASSPTASSAPAATARAGRSASASVPLTYQPDARRAKADRPADQAGADDVGPPLRAGRKHGGSAGEVVAQALGALEVDVAQLRSRTIGVEVDEDPDAPGSARHDVELACAQQRHVADSELPGRLGRELRPDVVGRGEDRR